MNYIIECTRRSKIKLNEIKLNDINFPSKKVNSAEVIIKGQGMPPANEVKYLGITLPAKLSWKKTA